MIVLGLDTATTATVVGLTLADGRVLHVRDDPDAEQRPGHSTRLLPLAGELLEKAGLDWSDLERIAVGVGPGTFTGLRIGIATARGLSQSSGVTLVGVSSLRALAYGASVLANDERVETDWLDQRHDRPWTDGLSGAQDGVGVLAVVDARRAEVFVAAYDGELEVLAPRVIPPEEVGELLAHAAVGVGIESWVAIGDGAVRYREAIERSSVRVPDDCCEFHRIQAQAICALGAAANVAEAPIVPDYLRRPDAEIVLEGATS
jgi:tRNA threonylcarbamoyladenosine biosynthesis protein TsaB